VQNAKDKERERTGEGDESDENKAIRRSSLRKGVNE